MVQQKGKNAWPVPEFRANVQCGVAAGLAGEY